MSLRLYVAQINLEVWTTLAGTAIMHRDTLAWAWVLCVPQRSLFGRDGLGHKNAWLRLMG